MQLEDQGIAGMRLGAKMAEKKLVESDEVEDHTKEMNYSHNIVETEYWLGTTP